MDSGELNIEAPFLTEAALDSLKAAGPWMFFMGIFGFTGCGIMLVSGFAVLISASNIADIPYFWDGKGRLVIGLLYILIAVAAFFISRYLFLAGSKLRALKVSGRTEDLEAALINSGAYWKFSAILTIVFLGIVIIILLAGIIAAAFAWF